MSIGRVEGDLLVGMKAICNYVGVSEITALKYHRELGLPMRKSSRNGKTGGWLSSKTRIDEWARGLADLR